MRLTLADAMVRGEEAEEVGLDTRSDESASTAQQHVLEAEQYVADLKRILEELVRDKHPAQADLARRVLRTLEESLTLAREHLAREQAKLARETAGWSRHIEVPDPNDA
jgi:hypothetical protein